MTFTSSTSCSMLVSVHRRYADEQAVLYNFVWGSKYNMYSTDGIRGKEIETKRKSFQGSNLTITVNTSLAAELPQDEDLFMCPLILL